MEPDSVTARVDPGGSTLRVDSRSDGASGPVVRASQAPLVRRIEAIATRTIDLVIAVVGLVVLSPLLIAIAIAVRATSDGPALYRQQRLGKGLAPFWLYKFRSMRPDASETPHREYVQALICSDQSSPNGNLYKLSVDNRVTTVGRFLRSWSLDEIPQLFNVLRGEMSLVGPRPVIGYEVELYPESYLRRFAVRPGLTGLWQVSGRSERTYDEMVALDIEYVERHSLWLDVRILGRTIPVVLCRRGVA